MQLNSRVGGHITTSKQLYRVLIKWPPRIHIQIIRAPWLGCEWNIFRDEKKKDSSEDNGQVWHFKWMKWQVGTNRQWIWIEICRKFGIWFRNFDGEWEIPDLVNYGETALYSDMLFCTINRGKKLFWIRIVQ